ncbi:MAG: hypothetical protein JWM11_467 [Planctomycetaceae bacterium]|nr:hypothetical protein [Planctomycetaceae bacterium]
MFRRLLVITILLVMLSGCSESKVEARAVVVPASGILTQKGQPIVGAQLTFVGDENSEPGVALTDAKGKFKCMTNDSSEGIRPGEYVVLVSLPGGRIHSRYAAAETSPLQVSVVEEGGNQFTLQLDD